LERREANFLQKPGKPDKYFKAYEEAALGSFFTFY